MDAPPSNQPTLGCLTGRLRRGHLIPTSATPVPLNYDSGLTDATNRISDTMQSLQTQQQRVDYFNRLQDQSNADFRDTVNAAEQRNNAAMESIGRY